MAEVYSPEEIRAIENALWAVEIAQKAVDLALHNLDAHREASCHMAIASKHAGITHQLLKQRLFLAYGELQRIENQASGVTP